MEQLKIEYVDKSELKKYANNAKIHTAEQIEQIKKSIEEFGFNDPIAVWHDNEIIEGHGRLLAVMEMDEIQEVPIIRLDELTDEKRKAYMLIHNKLTMNTDFDDDLLDVELADITDIDMSLFGFDFDDEDEPQEIIEDSIPEEVETLCKEGDLWILGEHRLICGDSTDVAVIDRLMDGVKADMVFTDPPYGVDYDGGVIHGSKINKEHKRQRLKNDDNDIYSEFIPILNRIIDNGAIYIFYATRNSYEILKPLKENGIEIHSVIIWNKINTGYADMNSHYKNKYEPCVYACRKGHSLNWHGGTSECTVWDINKDRDNKLHPTQKPIELPAKAINNSSKKGDVVLDFFGGSGSTLIACEQLNRKCYMCELDTHYCDVIIRRYINYKGTSDDVVLIRDGKEIPYRDIR